MSDKIKFFALGGLDESGKNMYIVEVNDKIFILDCGLKYPSKNITGVDAICSDMNYIFSEIHYPNIQDNPNDYGKMRNRS